MKILMVNKFLYPVGGAETYMLKLGAYWESQGHQVEYFGMDHPQRSVGNRWGLYTSQMDFHTTSLLEKAKYPLRVIYSSEAKKKMKALLSQFQPDVLHINNFNYQLTPSMLLSAEEYRKETGKNLRVIYTAHDAQLVCPNHLMLHPVKRQVCEKCIASGALNCIRGKCIHNSFLRSCLGAAEHCYWKWRRVYRLIDVIVCPSGFLKSKLDTNELLASKTVVLRNFVEQESFLEPKKGEYVLYFGRFFEEKGIRTLLEACRELPHIPFVFAGGGPLEHLITGMDNVRNVGFVKGQALQKLVRGARFSVCPSECNDNCPFSVIESIVLGTPVLGSNLGGIPELIRPGQTGWLLPPGNADTLRDAIESIWNSDEPERFVSACEAFHFDDLSEYAEKLLKFYQS